MAAVTSEPSKRTRSRGLRAQKPPGTSPGTLVVDPEARRTEMRVFAYDERELVERVVVDPADVCELLERFPVVWLDIDGLGDLDVIRAVGGAFHLHRLALEDVVDVRQRAKVDRYEAHQYIVAVMAALKDGRLDTEQLSLFLGANYVVTFQERPGDSFDRVRERIRGGQGLIRKGGAGYLTYALLDATIDAYFPVLEDLGERLERLEDELVFDPDPRKLSEIHRLRRDLLALRRAVWPLREALNYLIRESDAFFKPEVKPYLSDCYDHTVQIMDLVENYRETASGLMDVYLSSASNRMNEIMKVLTIIATIFIPLTFVVGVYGMNFDRASPWNMPELGWKYGYPLCWAILLGTTGFMLYYFRRRGWVGGARRRKGG